MSLQGQTQEKKTALDTAIAYLRSYDGEPLNIMEVCGTHTAAIFKGAIRSLISPKIRLISGPGCPVCVTPAAYIDRCIEYAHQPHTTLYSFGDMLKVPGTKGSLLTAKGQGAQVQMVYSPFEVLEKAAADPQGLHVVAAVGFETTAPIYGLMIQEMEQRGLTNIRFVTALKTVLPALHWLCSQDSSIHGFLCPGHVSVIIGCHPYEAIAETYGKPCVVAGFEPEHIITALYDLVRQIEHQEHQVTNHYRNAVKDEGNAKALSILESVFEPDAATWRGLGAIPASGLYLKPPFDRYDGGSRGLDGDLMLPEGCACDQVITGKLDPAGCPMFGTACTPTSPYGPCMVSAEGACGIWYRNR